MSKHHCRWQDQEEQAEFIKAAKHSDSAVDLLTGLYCVFQYSSRGTLSFVYLLWSIVVHLLSSIIELMDTQAVFSYTVKPGGIWST